MSDDGPVQRHPIFASHRVSAPDDYPPPRPGRVTRMTLLTPSGLPACTLLHDDQGVLWRPSAADDADAQEHGSEVLAYLRGMRAAGVDLADALDGVRAAYAGDLSEDAVRYAPTKTRG
jgi:hypothetical protein